MRIQTMESSSESSNIDFDAAPIVKCTGTNAANSIINMGMPDVDDMILESVKSGRITHRRDSFELDFEAIRDPE